MSRYRDELDAARARAEAPAQDLDESEAARAVIVGAVIPLVVTRR